MANKPGDDFETAIRPTLSVNNGVAAVAFYKKAFNQTKLWQINPGMILKRL
jgi:hypothetical protein